MPELQKKKLNQAVSLNPDEEIITNLELLINMDVLEQVDIWDEVVVLLKPETNELSDILESER